MVDTTSDRPGAAQGSAGILALLLRHWWIPFLVATVLTVASHLLMKGGVMAEAARPASGLVAALGAWGQPLVLAGLVLYGLAMIFWMTTVSRQDVSFLYPLTSVNYALVVAGSALFFGEVISLSRALGVVLVMAGVALVNLGPRRARS